jgi:hypothetical protein
LQKITRHSSSYVGIQEASIPSFIFTPADLLTIGGALAAFTIPPNIANLRHREAKIA